MLLLLSSFITSFDAFITGLILGLNRIKINYKNYLIILLTCLIIMIFSLIIYQQLNILIMNHKISALIFFVMGLLNIKRKNNVDNIDKNQDFILSIKESCLTGLSLSVDTTVIGLTLSDKYNFLLIAFIFTLTTVFAVFLGKFFSKAKIFNKIKDNQYIGALLFTCLAILLYFEVL